MPSEEQIEAFLTVVRAHLEGRAIQFRDLGSPWRDTNTMNVYRDTLVGTREFRVKPLDTTFVPWELFDEGFRYAWTTPIHVILSESKPSFRESGSGYVWVVGPGRIMQLHHRGIRGVVPADPGLAEPDTLIERPLED